MSSVLKADKAYWKQRSLYKWFIFHVELKKIITGYEYQDDAKEYLSELGQYSSTEHLKKYSKTYLKSIGIDAADLNAWAR